MSNKRRVKKNKQRGMHRRLKTGKKPMSPEQKEARKKMIEAQRAANLERLSNMKKNSDKK